MIWLLPRSDPKPSTPVFAPTAAACRPPRASCPTDASRACSCCGSTPSTHRARATIGRASIRWPTTCSRSSSSAPPSLSWPRRPSGSSPAASTSGEEVIPLTRASTPLPPAGGAPERLPAIAALRAPQVDFSEALCEEMARRRLSLCLHTLRAAQDCPFMLDVYLWDRCYGDCALPGAPPAHSRLARYQALADHPSPWPAPDEVREFENDLGKARETLGRLWDEAHPPGDFDDDIAF